MSSRIFRALAALLLACMISPSIGRAAEEIVDASGVKGGLIVCVGCGDPEGLVALRRGDGYLVQGLDVDAERVASARAYIAIRDLARYVDPVKAAQLPPTKRNVKLQPVAPAAETAPMPLNDIVEFNVWGTHASRRGETIELLNINGVDITSLKPRITISPGATIAPASRTPVDLTTPQTYVVTVADGTTKEYTVSIRSKGEQE